MTTRGNYKTKINLQQSHIGWTKGSLPHKKIFLKEIASIFEMHKELNNSSKKYIIQTGELIEKACIQMDSDAFLFDLRINSSITGPRRHADGIPVQLKTKHEGYTKFAMTLQGPGTLLLNNDEISQKKYQYLREYIGEIEDLIIDNNYQYITKAKDKMLQFHELCKEIGLKKAKTGEIVNRRIGGFTPHFHSEPIFLHRQKPRILAQVIPVKREDIRRNWKTREQSERQDKLNF